jgi:hypothetical protein
MDSNTKQELQENMTHYENELSSEMLKLGNRSRELVTKGLIIGGSVALAWGWYTASLRARRNPAFLTR